VIQDKHSLHFSILKKKRIINGDLEFAYYEEVLFIICKFVSYA